MEVVYNISQHLSENKIKYQKFSLGDIIDDLGSEYDYEQNDIKGCILSLVAAGCFKREPEDAKLSEQKLSFIPQSSEQAINILKEVMYRKLEDLLENVEDEMFSAIFSESGKGGFLSRPPHNTPHAGRQVRIGASARGVSSQDDSTSNAKLFFHIYKTGGCRRAAHDWPRSGINAANQA